MSKQSFAAELDALIRKHLGKVQFSEDFDKVVWPLYEAAERISVESGAFPTRDPVPGLD